MEEVNRKDDVMQRHMNEVASQNHQLVSTLNNAETNVSEMKQRTAEFENTKYVLAVRI